MNKLSLTLTLAIATSCGYTSQQNEMVGQVKRVVTKTPILCGDYVTADISLGVLRNGTGSTSKEDIWVYVPNDSDVATLKTAADGGQPVKVGYDVKRWPAGICVPVDWVTYVTIVKE